MKNAIKSEFFVNEASKVTIFDNFIRIETFVYVKSVFADVLAKHNYDDVTYKLLENKFSKPYMYYCVELLHGKYSSISTEANKAYCHLKSRIKYLTSVYKFEIRDALFEKEFQATINFTFPKVD